MTFSPTLAFTGRCRREILRDPLSLIFGVGLPLVLLVLISTIQKNISVDIFSIERFAPGMSVFSLTFLMLFGGLLLATDRITAFLSRIFASPMHASSYILAYALPLLPLGLVQGGLCLVVAALFFDLSATLGLLWAELALIPASLLFIGFGLLFGVLCAEKQVGAVASIVIQVASLLGGIWFDLDLIGGSFGKFARCLPFCHAVQSVQDALSGNLTEALLHAAVVLGYAAMLFIAASILFGIKMRRGNT